ncbi:MAG: hypothetical protein JW795_01160 [Chitinivibrionales bacterium]|nr:hypothetical protein [Chitinivibrionales bacterium]
MIQNATILLLILLCGYACVRLGRSIANKQQMRLLITVRIFLTAALIIIVIQPVVQLTLFRKTRPVLPVLIDLSMSMRSFNTDFIDSISRNPQKKTVHRTSSNTTAEKGGATPADAVRIQLYGFGDSLRLLQPGTKVEYNDTKSQFPHLFTDQKLRSAPAVLLVTDGHWSNPIPQNSPLYDKECYYLVLKQSNHVPFLSTETVQTPLTFDQHIDTTVILSIQGYHPAATSIRIQSDYDTEKRWGKIIQTDSGFFEKTVPIPVPTNKEGVHRMVIRTSLTNGTNETATTAQVLYTVMKQEITAYCAVSIPSLDKRFMTLAIRGRKQWRLLDTLSEKTPVDVIFYFNTDQSPDIRLKNTARALSVYIGCMPCGSTQNIAVRGGKIEVSPYFEQLLHSQQLDRFPPVKYRSACPDFIASTLGQPYVWLKQAAPATNAVGPEPIPLIYEVRKAESSLFIVAMNGIWQWDFWPQLSDAAGQVPPFSDALLTLIQKAVEKNTAASLLAVVDRLPLFEQDSCRLRIIPPSYFQNGTATTVDARIKTLSGTIIAQKKDTLYFFPTQLPLLALAPLTFGTYRYDVTIVNGGQKAHYADSLTVEPYNGEFRVFEQNSLLLNAVGKEITSSADLETVLQSMQKKQSQASLGATDTIQLRLERHWLFLACLLLFFSGEWVIRRVARLDYE